MIVYVAIYKKDLFADPLEIISIHSTEEGAKVAMEDHKKTRKSLKKSYINEFWDVEEWEVES